MPPEEKQEESVTVGETTFTKADVKAMDAGEFDHAVAFARQQGTPEGEEQAAALEEFRGKRKVDEAPPSQ